MKIIPEFNVWNAALRAAITLLFVLCVLSQTQAAVLGFYRRRRGRGQMAENLLEIILLAYLLTCSLLHGRIIQACETGLTLPVAYGGLRLAVFAAAAIFSVAVAVLSRKAWPLPVAAVTALTLPFAERITGRFFAYLFTTALIALLARSLFTNLSRFREIRTSLSALSIKNVIDSLHTGVMFCEEDGFILLANAQMQRLMTVLTGKVQRNGRHFFSLLTLEEIEPRCRITWFEGQNVVILPDGPAWIFTLTELRIKSKKYIQLTATDITERWCLTTVLQPQNEELLMRQKQLSEAIAGLYVLSRERETQRAKMRVHDILGERLTLLLRIIRSEQPPDYDLLRILSQGLIDELKAAQSTPSPQDELEILQQTFAAIGVEIIIGGSLPEDSAKGQLFADVAREAVTNAVRHGLATQVFIHMDASATGCSMKITDNGHPPSGAIREGGGISGMRKKLEPFGGTLHIAVQQCFILTIDLPGGGMNV